MSNAKIEGLGMVRSKRECDQFYGKTQSSVGPGEYNHHAIPSIHQPAKNVGFMSSNIRFGSSKEITPGPAHYVNMQSHQLSVRSPTLPKMNSSFSSRVGRIGPVNNNSNTSYFEQIPGPGAYNHHYSSSERSSPTLRLAKVRFQALSHQVTNKLRSGIPSIPFSYAKSNGACVGVYNPEYNSIKAKVATLPISRAPKQSSEPSIIVKYKGIFGENNLLPDGVNIYSRQNIDKLLTDFNNSIKVPEKTREEINNLSKEISTIESERWGGPEKAGSSAFKSTTKKGKTLEAQNTENPGPGTYESSNVNPGITYNSLAGMNRGTFGQASRGAKFRLNQNSLVFLTGEEERPGVGHYTLDASEKKGKRSKSMLQGPSSFFVSNYRRDCMKQLNKNTTPGPATYKQNKNLGKPLNPDSKQVFGSTCARFKYKSELERIYNEEEETEGGGILVQSKRQGMQYRHHPEKKEEYISRILESNIERENHSQNEHPIREIIIKKRQREIGKEEIEDIERSSKGIQQTDEMIEEGHKLQIVGEENNSGNTGNSGNSSVICCPPSRRGLKKYELSNSNSREAKGMIQNVINNLNGIAFGTHSGRFASRNIGNIYSTPGPGAYGGSDTINTGTVNSRGVSFTMDDRFRAGYPKHILHNNRLKEDNNLINKSLGNGNASQYQGDKGPGAYYKDHGMLKHSFNVTFPDNILIKRRNQIIHDKLFNNS